ncbi:GNAT family N-acetyltransferase [Microbacteriaceae bacterium VKM Ac-2855]|nr:GNAT family N-acetyltransferase [Microbacteriaceae bacterium VKM Ac-2855]
MTPLRLPYEAEPITTERMRLRPLRMSDAADHAVYQGDAETVRYLPWPLRDAEQSRAHLVKRSRAVRLEHDHDVVVLAMVPRDGAFADRVIGDLTLILADPANATVEIGWVLRADARGAGYAAEGARALLELAFDRLGAHRVVAQLDARNTASAALCERLGMTLEAHFVHDQWFKGEWTDSLHYALRATL